MNTPNVPNDILKDGKPYQIESIQILFNIGKEETAKKLINEVRYKIMIEKENKYLS